MKTSLLATLLLASGVAAQAQIVQPNAPDLAVQRARAFAQALGYPLATAPAHRTSAFDPDTRRSLTTTGWRTASGTIAITVDPLSGQITRWNDDSDRAQVQANFRSGAATTVSVEAATARVRASLRAAGAPDGDWRATEVSLREWIDGEKAWLVYFHQYIDGFPSSQDLVYARVNPYTQQLQHFALVSRGVHLAATRPLISESAAQSVARDTWTRAGGSNDVAPRLRWNGPAWITPSARSPITRLAYAYRFDVQDATSGPASYEAVVDAQSGQLWSLSPVTGGAAPLHPIAGAAPITLAASLLDAGIDGLGRAIASGTPIRARATAGRTLTCQAQGRSETFVWDAATRRLSWSAGTVALTDDEARRLDAWFSHRAQ